VIDINLIKTVISTNGSFQSESYCFCGGNKFVIDTIRFSLVHHSTIRKTNIEVKLGGWKH